MNLPAVDDGEEGPLGEAEGGASDIPVVFMESEDDVDPTADVIDIDMALAQETDVEPIESVEWPDPNESQIASLEIEPADGNDQNLDTDSQSEDADASLTGA